MYLSLPDAFAGVELLLRLDQARLAEEALDAIAAAVPEAARLHLFCGWLMLRDQNLGLAAKHFRLSLGRDPLEPLALQGLAASLQPGPEQQTTTERAERLRTSKAVADLRRGKPYLARAPLQLLHANHPNDQEWTLLLVECLRRLGEIDSARIVLGHQLDRVPVSAPAALLAAAMSEDEYVIFERLREAARGDPTWSGALQLWTPDGPPLQLPTLPEIQFPDHIQGWIAAVGNPPQTPWQVPLGLSSAMGPRAQGQPKLGAKGANSPAASAPPQGARQADLNSEVAEVLEQIQRVTHRIFGRSPAALAAGDAVALLVTHRGSLTRRYGAAVAAEVEQRMGHLKAALTSRGLLAEIIILDQPGGIPGVQVVSNVAGNTGAQAITQVLRNARRNIEAHNHRLDAILLVGGDGIIPFHRLKNPSQDADQALYSDNPYGCDGGSEHVPDVVVSRLPDGGNDGGALLLTLLQRSIDHHEGWLVTHGAASGLALPMLRRLVGSSRVRSAVPAWGATTASWQEPSDLVFHTVTTQQPLLLCPPGGTGKLGSRGGPDWSTDRILYFNLHGLPGGPNWYGQAVGATAGEPLPVALTPVDIGEVAPVTICVTEACYGAEIMGRSPSDALALQFLNRGALAFVGCTATAYGAVGLPLGGADILAQQLFMNLRRGQPVGRALLLARDSMARETVALQGYLDPDDAKTLLSFVLLGDPWASPYTKSAVEAKLAVEPRTPAIEPVIAHRQMLHATAVAPGAIELVRRLVAKIAPQFARAPLMAAGQGHPDRIAKGQIGTVVFSAAADIPTIDGRHFEQIARVTVAHGAARKLLLTR